MISVVLASEAQKWDAERHSERRKVRRDGEIKSGAEKWNERLARQNTRNVGTEGRIRCKDEIRSACMTMDMIGRPRK